MAAGRIEVTLGARIDELLNALDQASTQTKQRMSEMNSSIQTSTSIMNRDLTSFKDILTGVFAGGALASFVKRTTQAVSDAEAAFRSLEGVANASGVGIAEAMQRAGNLAADGLMTTAEASKSLSNLLSRGYSLDQAEQMLMRLKDTAAFSRAAHLELGQAVVNATEGFKNENSTLVDNVGLTKNLSILWKEYAADLGIASGSLTQAQKVQAEYNGTMRETEAQLGDAAVAAAGLQGATGRLKRTTTELDEVFGQALLPTVTAMKEGGVILIENFVKPLMFGLQSVAIYAAQTVTGLGSLWEAVKNMEFSGLAEKYEQQAALAEQARLDAVAKLQSGASFDPRPNNRPSAAGGGGADTTNTTTTTTTKSGGGGAKSRLDALRAGMQDEATQYGLNSGGAQYSLEQERDYWQRVLDGERLSAADRASVQRTLAQTRLEILRQENADALSLAGLTVERDRAAALEKVAIEQDAAEQQKTLGQITQLEMLQLEQQFELRRLDISRQALLSRMELLDKDPSTSPVARLRLLNEIEEMERGHAERLRDIRGGIEAEGAKDEKGDLASGMESALSSGFNRMLTTATSFGDGLRGIFSSVFGSISQMIAKTVAEWAVSQLTMKAATIAAKTEETSVVVAQNASQAASGAAASQAGIPIIGPVLAVAAAAAMLALVSGFATKSAAGGYDIPSGVNPMVQTHAEEMILPAKYANVIRGLAGGEEGAPVGGGGGGTVNLSVQAMDGASVKRLFENNGRLLAKVLQDQGRDFFK